MNKLNITLNLSKVDKTRIIERMYKDENGNDVIAKDYKVEAIELKQSKLVAEGPTWKLNKTHFVVDAQTKEEKEQKKPSNYVGEGFTFESKGSPEAQNAPIKVVDDETGAEIPF